MWELRGQFSKPNPEGDGTELEWNSLFVNTKEEAEVWWSTRTSTPSAVCKVATMFDPERNVIRVHFD